MNKLKTRVLGDERCAGKRAKFHVYHRDDLGRLRVDASYAETFQKADLDILAAYRELGRRITVVRVVAVDQSVEVV